jgi:hypothetical protein
MINIQAATHIRVRRVSRSYRSLCAVPFTSTEVVYGVTGTDVTVLPEYGVSA